MNVASKPNYSPLTLKYYLIQPRVFTFALNLLRKTCH